MNKALIGHTGFIGSNLATQMVFQDFYNSKNIEEIRGKEYDLVISAANPGVKWRVNQEPEKDWANISKFMEIIKTIKVGVFVLISSIDVYKNPQDVDEESPILMNNAPWAAGPYGQHRFQLENFIQQQFKKHLIIRIPIIYGPNFRKNIIYDVLNNHEVGKIDPTARLQFYHIKHLTTDIQTATMANLQLLNLATTPIVVKELFVEALGLTLDNTPGPGRVYDMKTKYANCFGKSGNYISDRFEVVKDLENFKKQYRI